MNPRAHRNPSRQHLGPIYFGKLCIPQGDDPEVWLSQLVKAFLEGYSVALLSPEIWQRDRQRLTKFLQGLEPNLAPGSWLIPTGGSSGEQKLALHSTANLTEAANAYWQHFPNAKRNALVTLPLWHVSGLMAWMRAVVAGGDVLFSDYKDWHSGNFPDIHTADFRLSLVPTQLRRLMSDPNVLHWLCGFECIHLGGAGAEQSLLEQAREAGLNLSPCYGMTETAAMIVAMHPKEFLQGQPGCGSTFPGVQIWIDESNSGRLMVDCPWLCEKVLPTSNLPKNGKLPTPDRGFWSHEGSLVIKGRMDRIINSGGEKIAPEPMEQLLKSHPGVQDALVWGIPHSDWGQQVVAMIAAKEALSEASLNRLLDEKLPRYSHPKHIYWCQEIPRTGVGKPDWTAIRSQIGPQTN